MNNRRENSRQKRKLEEVRRQTDTRRETGTRKRPVSRSRKQGPLRAATLLTVIAILLTALTQLVPRTLSDRTAPAAVPATSTEASSAAADRTARAYPDGNGVPGASTDRVDRAPAAVPSGSFPAGSGGDRTASPASPDPRRNVGRSDAGESPERIAAAARTAPRREVGPAPIPGSARIVLVIDDVGYNLHQLEPFLRFPGPITFAVLPGLQYSTAAAKRILEAGKGLILHQPMEASGGGDPGPGAILTRMSDEEVVRVLEANLAQLPGVQGVNNHMGSLATADERIMRLVLGRLRERDLLFLDSRTTPDTRSGSAARAVDFTGILERTVFLDNEADRDAIREAFEGGLEQARSRGRTVMIGHVWTQELADFLFELYPTLIEDGYEFSDLTDLLLER